uniref:Uncharacterized protein n=1 Tax=Spongospora subterranea TaxID=70186 RepID=A0A0H5R0U3_9EUKA|eukprot:CRZ07828.1 hypothetical protein [Spongospora subterranea]
MVIAETGDLYGWGCNAVGQLGIGEDTKVSMLPVRINVVSANDRVRQVACAKTMTGVITQSGSLLVWGSLNGHQLSTTPKLVTMDHNFCGSLVDIVCGYEMALITAIPRQCDPSSPDQVTESAGQAESNCEEKSTQRKRAPPTSEAENCGAGLRETNVINNALTSAKINSLEQGSLWAQIRIESRSDYVLRVNLPGTSLSTLLSAVRAHIQQATDTTEFMFLFRNTTNAISFRQENSVKLSEIIVQENTDNIDMNTIYIRTMIGHNTASKPNIVARSTTLASTIPDKLMVCEVSEPKVIKLKGVSSHDERPRSASQLAKFFESDILDRKPSSALKAKPSISRSSVSKEMPITKQPIAESSLPIQSLKDPISLGAPALAAVAIDDISVRNAQASIQRKSSITAGKETSFHLAARPTLSGHTPEKRLPSRISSSSNLLQEKIEVFIEGTDTVIGFVFMPRIRTLKLEDLRAVINDSLSDRIPQEYLFMTDGAPISTKQESKFGVFGTVGNKAILRPVIPEKEQPETETLLKVFITIPNESRKILGAVLVPSIATTTMSDIRSQIIEDIGYQTSKPWCFVIDQYKINISEEPSQMLEEYLKNSYGSIVIGPAFSENSTTPKLERGNQKVSKSR